VTSAFRLPIVFVLLAAACGGGDANSDLPATDSIAGMAPVDSAAPRVITGVTNADTLARMAPMKCSGGLVLHSTYWTGVNPRVVLGMPDTVIVLKRAETATGARYAVESPLIEWLDRGDSASFTKGGRTVSCERAEAGEVDF
jgi:membrane-bound inhibitor of C-type lysozyme